MHAQTRIPTIAVTQKHQIEQLTRQTTSLIASLTQFDALFDASDKDRSVQHVEHVLNATLAVVVAARCYVADDPHSRLALALAELDAAKGNNV